MYMHTIPSPSIKTLGERRVLRYPPPPLPFSKKPKIFIHFLEIVIVCGQLSANHGFRGCSFRNLRHKPKQKEALEANAMTKRDCLIVHPRGYDKSLIYQLLSSLCDHLAHKKCFKNKSIVTMVSPLNALIEDQLNKLKSIGNIIHFHTRSEIWVRD